MSMKPRHILHFCLIVSVIYAFPGCSQPETVDPVFDFIMKLPEASREHDLFVIDMSNPEHFKYLGDGWHVPDNRDIPVTRFVWSSALESFAFVESQVQENKELILTIRPYLFEGSPPVTVSVLFNHDEIGQIRLKDEWRTYRLKIPAALVLKGRNELILKQAQVFQPSQVMLNSDDQRFLGSSYSYIVLRQERDPKQPALYTVQQTLGAENMTWGGRQRHLIFSQAPSRFSWDLLLPSKPILRFGAGFVPERFDVTGPDAQFRILLKEQTGQEHVLFNTRIRPPERVLEMGWREFNRNLDKFAGQRVEISFLTESESDEKGISNSGSWLEPLILNRHSDVNIIFLPIAAFFNPDEIPAGSGLDKLLFNARLTPPIEPLSDPAAGFSGIPLDLVNSLSSEGWPIGFFGTGQDISGLMMKRLERPLDAFFPYDFNASEAYEMSLSDCQDWLKALDSRRFVLIFDPAGQDPASAADREKAIGIADFLLEHWFDRDSLILVYNASEESPVWVLNPTDRKWDGAKINDWKSLSDSILKILDIPG